MGKARSMILLLAAALTILSFQNCDKAFSSKRAGSREAIFETRLFAADGTSATPSENLPPPEGFPPDSGTPTPPPYGGGPTPPPGGYPPGYPTPSDYSNTPYVQSVNSVCGNSSVAAMRGSVKTLKEVKVVFREPSGSVACEVADASIREDFINERHLKVGKAVEKCPAVKNGTFILEVKSEMSGNLMTLQKPANMSVKASANIERSLVCLGGGLDQDYCDVGLWYALSNFHYGVPVPYKINAGKDAYHVEPAEDEKVAVLMDVNNIGVGKGEGCDFAGSPLLVQIRKGDGRPRKIELTAPLSGVKFDILGKNSFPAPHVRKKISWFTSQSAVGNYFVVLPNAQGEVNGVDQLFGDNTLGPDGRFAANGYEALRKYDSRRDGKIDRSDEVFSRLKLWSDKNGDGYAAASELYRLDELGVVFIDLSYDPHYKETDRYGNEIKMKSHVRTTDGIDHVMYDIWFRIID